MRKDKWHFNAVGSIFLTAVFLTGCGSSSGNSQKAEMTVKETASVTPYVVEEYQRGVYGEKENDIRFTDYYKLSDGTWRAEDWRDGGGIYDYKYCFEVQGILRKSSYESEFVILSNTKNISFEDAQRDMLTGNTEKQFDHSQTMRVGHKIFMDVPKIVEHYVLEDAFSDSKHAPIMNYYKLKDDTWRTDTDFYKYHIKKKGTVAENKGEEEFVVLSNTKDVSMEDIRNYLQGNDAGALSDKSNAVLVDREEIDS